MEKSSTTSHSLNCRTSGKCFLGEALKASRDLLSNRSELIIGLDVFLDNSVHFVLIDSRIQFLDHHLKPLWIIRVFERSEAESY